MNDTVIRGGGAGFPPTRASLLQRAVDRDGSEYRCAWEELFRAYAPPLYAWLRRTGSPRETALDLLQDFFTEGLEGDLLSRYDPARGRLRTYLLACLRNQRLERVRHEGARPDRRPLPVPDTESRAWEPADPASPDPEAAFEREWARQVLARSVAALERRWEADRDALSIRLLREWVIAESRPPAATLAEALGITTGDLYTRATRLRREIGSEMESQVRLLGGGGDPGTERDELLRALAE